VAVAGATVEVGAILGVIRKGAEGRHAPVTSSNPDAVKVAGPVEGPALKTPVTPPPAPAAAPTLAAAAHAAIGTAVVMPAARRVAEEAGIEATSVAGTGKDGRVSKGDVLAELEARAQERVKTPAAPVAAGQRVRADREERVAMTRLRKTIALRLKESQNTAAQLTTFNEIDMSHVMALRSQYKDQFEKKHKVKLGFMGFFVKACVAALKDLPNVNAEIEGDNIVYKNYFDIGVAVSTERGLVVPVLRDADHLSLAGLEAGIADFGARARNNQLKLEELQGGSFSITNGGVFGSLMSTPILNSPQSGILGMHKIQERPVAIGGKIEIRPMMYLALSYDHRIVDGKEAVTFLVRVKEALEDPARLVLDL